MKKVFLAVAFISISMSSFAQKIKVNSAWNYLKYEEYDKAKSAIDDATLDESSKDMWKTWYYRGLIYKAIHEKNKEKELNAPNALATATQAFQKSLDIDPKHDYAEDLTQKYFPQIMQEYGDSAFANYNNKNYASAYENFKHRMDVYNTMSKFVKLPIDTGAIYNEAIMADKAGKMDAALPLYQQAADMGYKDAFAPLARNYCIAKDTAKAIATLEKGTNIAKNDADILKAYINILYSNRKYEMAIAKVNDVIKLEPNNEILFVFLGQIYDIMGKPTESAAQYDKAFKINPNNFEVLKAIGVNIFNQAVIVNKQANEVPAEKQAEYDNLIKKRNEILERALTYLEKAYKINPDDEELKTPYNKTKTLLKK